MNKYIFIFLIPTINFCLFELFFFYPRLFYFILIAINLLIFFSLKKIKGKKITEKSLWNISILPIFFSTSLMIYSALITNNFFIHFLFVVNLLFTYYYLKSAYFKDTEHGGVKDSFENISSYGNFLTLFFASASIYGLKAFLGIPVWLLIIAMAIIILLIVYEAIWANRIKIRQGGAYILIVCLLLIQIAWSIYFLPLNHNTLGLILAICYYILIGLTKSFLRDNLNRRTIKLYLIFGLGSIVLILLTAKWA